MHLKFLFIIYGVLNKACGRLKLIPEATVTDCK